jgi:hypothetical protein
VKVFRGATVEAEADRRALREYAERWGILFENLGAARMMGKILGWLLVCDPPEQSAGELASGLGASAGSVSTATRSLMQAGMIERVGIPGRRSACFRVRPGMWGDLLERRMSFGRTMGELAEDGLRLMRSREAGDGAAPGPTADPARELRLEEILSYCRYVEDELPAFVERWRRAWREQTADSRNKERQE